MYMARPKYEYMNPRRLRAHRCSASRLHSTRKSSRPRKVRYADRM